MRPQWRPRLDLRRNNDGVSAVEFALILPALLVLVLAGFQVIVYVDATRKVSAVAYSVAQLISQAAPAQGSNVAKVTATDLHFAYDSSTVVFPYMLKDAAARGIPWWQNISVAFASIQFDQTSTSCAAGSDMSNCYKARVVWASTGTTGGTHRPCTPAPVAADDSAPPSQSTLPRSSYGPGSVIAVDINFTFQPTFGAAFLPTFKISRSVFLQPRYASLVDYDTATSDGIAAKCP